MANTIELARWLMTTLGSLGLVLLVSACAPPGYRTEFLGGDFDSSDFDQTIGRNGVFSSDIQTSGKGVAAGLQKLFEKERAATNSAELLNFLELHRSRCARNSSTIVCSTKRYMINRTRTDELDEGTTRMDFVVTTSWSVDKTPLVPNVTFNLSIRKIVEK